MTFIEAFNTLVANIDYEKFSNETYYEIKEAFRVVEVSIQQIEDLYNFLKPIVEKLG